MSFGIDQWCWGQNIFYAGFGFTNWTNDICNDLILQPDGTVNFVSDDDNYRAALEYFHNWFAEGLIDQEAFSQTDTQYMAKCSQGEVGVATWWYIEELMGDYADDYVFLPVLAGPDARHWTYRTTLDRCNGEYGKMWECPDFFPLEDRQVLIVSPQEMEATPDGEFHAGYGVVALVGRYDKAGARFTREWVQTLDSGLDFYAPQSVVAPDGRRILIGWMENWETVNRTPRRHRWFGRMSLPREAFLREGRLCQRPVRELETLWQDTLTRRETLDGDAAWEGVSGRRLDLTVTLDLAASPDCRRFTLRFAEDGCHHTDIAWDPAAATLVLDRSLCGIRQDFPNRREVPVAPRDGKLVLRLILDSDCMELFVNDGERVLSAIIETPVEADGLSLHSEGAAALDLVLHHLG